MQKILALLMCIVMLVSVAACAGTDKAAGETLKTSGDDNGETNSGELKPDLPDKNFNGAAFTFINRGADYGGWNCVDCFAESENGEPINDAVYRRNMIIEDRYNIKITEFKGSTGMERTLYNSIIAGEKIYDAAMVRGTDAAFLAENNVLIDLHTINYINLGNPWWDQNANKDFSIGGRLFFTACDIGISDKDGSWVMVFNKRVREDNQLENPYDIVNAGKWTVTKVHEMGKTVSRDLDGDGKMTKEDMWGITAEPYDTYALLFAGGERIYKNNAEGYPELVVYSERSVKVIDNYMQMVKDTDNYLIISSSDTPFIPGRALFMSTTLLAIRNAYRNIDDDFGILPVPKFDEIQENYGHIVSIGTSGATITVPITAPNLEMTGIILEDLAYESSKTVIPAYMDICFNNKYLRDKESVDMLKLCMDSRVYDFSILYTAWGPWFTYFYNLTAASNVNLASEYEKNAEATRVSIEQTVDLYKQLNK